MEVLLPQDSSKAIKERALLHIFKMKGMIEKVWWISYL